ncbi:unnamed protein product [Gadus morhua 'NCC']
MLNHLAEASQPSSQQGSIANFTPVCSPATSIRVRYDSGAVHMHHKFAWWTGGGWSSSRLWDANDPEGCGRAAPLPQQGTSRQGTERQAPSGKGT